MPKQWVENRKTICIDFNGVLDTYVGWKGSNYMYPPRDGVEDFLKKLKEEGYKVIILTAMDAFDVRLWLVDNNLSYLVYDVTNVKEPAIVYLDDRAVTFNGDFGKAFNDIINFKTFWEDPEHREGGKVEDRQHTNNLP